MGASEWIAIAAALIASISLVYTWKSNTKKYELTDQYRVSLLDWFNKTTELLIRLKIMTRDHCLDNIEKCNLQTKQHTTRVQCPG